MKQNSIVINFEEYNSLHELSSIDQQLLTKASEAAHKAYAPYSNFKVGASALLTDNKIITSANCENASYGASICAERVLITNAILNHLNNEITTIAITAFKNGTKVTTPITCCGICRQTILEYETIIRKPLRIIMESSNTIWIVNGINNLSPLSFTKTML